jgi:hypothetical protein
MREEREKERDKYSPSAVAAANAYAALRRKLSAPLIENMVLLSSPFISQTAFVSRRLCTQQTPTKHIFPSKAIRVMESSFNSAISNRIT